MPNPYARRLFELLEPIPMVTFFAREPAAALLALGLRGYWDGYFAGRAAPLGLVPPEVVHAAFYSFADGEVARHIPRVWGRTTPEQAWAARQQGSAAAVRRILGDLADTSGLVRAADLTTRAATSAPTPGRVMYAALRALPVPEEPVARLWHCANMLREHRGDGHIAALMAEGIGGTEAHVLYALSHEISAEKFGRVSHLPPAQLAAVVDGMRARGLVEESGWLSAAGRECGQRVESLTDDLAAVAYDGLTADERDRLVADLEPLSAALAAAGSR